MPRRRFVRRCGHVLASDGRLSRRPHYSGTGGDDDARCSHAAQTRQCRGPTRNGIPPRAGDGRRTKRRTRDARCGCNIASQESRAKQITVRSIIDPATRGTRGQHAAHKEPAHLFPTESRKRKHSSGNDGRAKSRVHAAKEFPFFMFCLSKRQSIGLIRGRLGSGVNL